MSASLALAHEMGHAKQKLTDYDGLGIYGIFIREQLNLSKTENPICKELGEPIRLNYLDGIELVKTGNSIAW